MCITLSYKKCIVIGIDKLFVFLNIQVRTIPEGNLIIKLSRKEKPLWRTNEKRQI